MNETSNTNKTWYRRGPVRALVPLAAAAVIAGGVALAPGLASAAPDLPAVTAQQLLAKAAGSNVDAFSGTVSVTADLGIPQLPDVSGGSAGPLSLLSGTHTLQVAENGPEQQRVALIDQLSEYDVIHNGAQLWTYDSTTGSVEHGAASGKTKQAEGQSEAKLRMQAGEMPVTPQAAAQRLLTVISPTTSVTVGPPRTVAGRSAYLLVLAPKQQGSLIGQAEISIDSATGAPLGVALYPAGSATPFFDVSFTSVSLTAPPASRFDFTPPKGATVTPFGGLGQQDTAKGRQHQNPDPQVLGTGWLSVLELHGVNLAQLTKAAAGAGSQAVQQGSDTSASSDGGSGKLVGGALNGYLSDLLGGGTTVSGRFGTGKLYRTSVVSALITSDGRVFLGAVTPQVLEADANAQGSE